MQSTITIHWDDRIDPEVAHRIADAAAGAVMDRVHDAAEETYDSDVSATLWERDEVT